MVSKKSVFLSGFKSVEINNIKVHFEMAGQEGDAAATCGVGISSIIYHVNLHRIQLSSDVDSSIILCKYIDIENSTNVTISHYQISSHNSSQSAVPLIRSRSNSYLQITDLLVADNLVMAMQLLKIVGDTQTTVNWLRIVNNTYYKAGEGSNYNLIEYEGSMSIANLWAKNNKFDRMNLFYSVFNQIFYTDLHFKFQQIYLYNNTF